MVTLDLQPLTEEIIAQMGFQSHDLWLVKIHDEVFGPFETESLKHYASENQAHFAEAHATRMDAQDYKPFWTHIVFQRRKIQAIGSDPLDAPFWLIHQGLKTGPYHFRDIDKKIEMGLLVMTDHISDDNGETWKKIFEVAGFDRRSHSPDELPEAPLEESFHKAKLALVEKMEHPVIRPTDELAGMAHVNHKQAKVIPFKIDEMTLQSLNTTEVSTGLKWMIPTAAAIILTVMTSGYIFFSPEAEEVHVADIVEVKEKQVEAKNKVPAPRGVIPDVAKRAPASVGYSQPAPQPRANAYNHESRYPTHVETHKANDRDMGTNDSHNVEVVDDPYYERDLRSDNVPDEKRPEEHSLVGSENREQDYSLDAAMNGVEQPAEPVVEEVSDF
jgi:hypothetical protein